MMDDYVISLSATVSWYYTVHFYYLLACGLQKEVARLRSLANGVAENHETDPLAVSFPGSPGNFKWEGLNRLSSPLTSNKRMSTVSTVS